jgi:predicted dienelactone hydrolase
MRRLTSGLLTGSLLLVAACGSGSDSAEPEPESTETAAPTSAEVPSTEAPVDSAADEPEPVVTEPIEEAPVETEAPAPELAEFPNIGVGEYDVGVQTIQVTDEERGRTLEVDVWFPLADDTAGEPHRYSFITGDYYESPRAISADAAAIASDGPFPLVVYTHGSGGLRYIHSDYTETIASHGYLVVAADHAGNTAIDQFLQTEDDRATIAYNRPRDVQVLIDQMTNPENTATAGFVGSVDPERVAVTGHSLGGYGTLAVGGGMSNEVGTIEPDPRVDALIPLAPAVGDGDPATSLLTADFLINVTAPVLVMVGTGDITTPPSPNVDRTFAEVSSEVVYRVDLVDAAHQSFTDVCDYLDFFPTLDNPTPEVVGIIEAFAVEGCSDGDMPIERVKLITNTFAISFLDSIFEGTEMITPEAFEIPDDVIYQVK